MINEDVTSLIIGAAYDVHNVLGAGFLEKVYQNALAYELRQLQLKVQCEVPINVIYKEHKVGEYYADILVNNSIILEIKTVGKIHLRHEIQLVNYLKATRLSTGLILNFGTKVEVKRKLSDL